MAFQRDVLPYTPSRPKIHMSEHWRGSQYQHEAELNLTETHVRASGETAEAAIAALEHQVRALASPDLDFSKISGQFKQIEGLGWTLTRERFECETRLSLTVESGYTLSVSGYDLAEARDRLKCAFQQLRDCLA